MVLNNDPMDQLFTAYPVSRPYQGLPIPEPNRASGPLGDVRRSRLGVTLSHAKDL
jgi:hypothetical protein